MYLLTKKNIMNETRKAIIKLIEPYMNKILDFWCLLRMEEDWKVWYWIYVNTEFNWGEWKTYFVNQDNGDCSLFCAEENNDYKIIWHYDITAVLKYISETTYWSIKFDCDTIKVYNDDCEFWTYLWVLLFKPIYLYTKQEEQDLLNLLLKLKN